MVDFRPLLFINALALMLLVTAGFASIQRAPDATDPVASSAQPDASPKQAQEPTSGKATSDDSSAIADLVSDRESDTPDINEDNIFADSAGTADDEPAGGSQQEQAAGNDDNGSSAQTSDLVGSEPDDESATFGSTLTDPAISAPTDNNSADAETTLAMTEPTMPDASGETPPTADKAEPKAKPEPKPTTAQITLRSNVVGDSVRINGKSYGATRLDLELKPGDYDVEISKQGFKTWQQTVRLDAGDDMTLRGNLAEYTRVNYQNGRWTGGVKTGDGTYKGKDGLQYNGHFVDGKFDGRGTAIYPNGDKYEGQWKADKPTEGTLRKANGAIYEGSFSNGKYSGQGTLTRANDDVLTGEWSGGELNGHGSLTTEEGKLYVGGFLNGKFHGEGTLTYPTGHTYEGSFSKGEYQGKGSEVFVDGKKYVGQYAEGKFHGKGTLMNPNGSSIKSTFRYGKPYGQATLTTPEGEVFHARSKEPGVCYRDKSYRATQCPPLEGW